MEKKILTGLFALTLLVATGYGVSKSTKDKANLSDLALANVEALAQNESNEDCTYDGYGCYNGLWWPHKKEVWVVFIP